MVVGISTKVKDIGVIELDGPQVPMKLPEPVGVDKVALDPDELEIDADPELIDEDWLEL